MVAPRATTSDLKGQNEVLAVEAPLYAPGMHPYPPLNVTVSTPRVELHGATDALLIELLPLVRAGHADADPPPFDDPMSLYDEDPDSRAQKWLRAIWRSRGRLEPDFWRLHFVVVIDGKPAGMQDVIGIDFDTYGTVTTFSWLGADFRSRGFGREMRAAALHLAFEGLGASEAASEAFLDNVGSIRVSETLGYERNGFEWATRRGSPAQLQRWRLTRDQWLPTRRDDIVMSGVEACQRALRSTS